MNNSYVANIGPRPTLSPKAIPNHLASKGCVVRSVNWLGDAVMTVPAVYRIKQSLPQGAKLSIVCIKSLEQFWASFPWVDQVIAMNGKHVKREETEKICNLKAGFAVIFPNSFGSALDLFLKNIPLRIGRGGRMRGFMLNRRLPSWRRKAGQDKNHQLREYLQIAQACGADAWDDYFEPAKPKIDLTKLERKGYKSIKDTWLAIAPGAAFGPAKQWPLSHYAQAAAWWIKEGGKCVILGAPGEEAHGEEVHQQCPEALNLVGKTSIPELMYILGESKFCIVNDSGAMHLAASVSAKGVAIFGSTDPTATGPLGGNWKVIWTRPDCSPCLQKQCPLPTDKYKCLSSATVEMVTNELDVMR
jgi:heptosyltransferase II